MFPLLSSTDSSINQQLSAPTHTPTHARRRNAAEPGLRTALPANQLGGHHHCSPPFSAIRVGSGQRSLEWKRSQFLDSWWLVVINTLPSASLFSPFLQLHAHQEAARLQCHHPTTSLAGGAGFAELRPLSQQPARLSTSLDTTRHAVLTLDKQPGYTHVASPLLWGWRTH